MYPNLFIYKINTIFTLMKLYYLFYLLSAFSFGGSFVFLTLGDYAPQTITMASLGVGCIPIGLFFRKYTK